MTKFRQKQRNFAKNKKLRENKEFHVKCAYLA
jgi:hypothetical protein